MEDRSAASSCDANYVMQPKQEKLDDLEVINEFDDDFVVSKEELSNTNLHIDTGIVDQKFNSIEVPIKIDKCFDGKKFILPTEDLSNTSVQSNTGVVDQEIDNMVTPIKTETLLSKEIAELRKELKSSDAMKPLWDTDVPTVHMRRHVKLTSFSVTEKNMVINAYKYMKETWPTDMYPYNKDNIVKKTADMLGISVPSVYRILKDYRDNSQITPPKTTKNSLTFSEKIDDFTKSAIRRKLTSFSVTVKNMVINAYKYMKKTWPTDMYPYKKDIVKKTADMLGISVSSVYKILKDYRENSQITPPKTTKNRPTFSEKMDDFTKSAIRRKVHSFYIKGELPTLKKVLSEINEDDTLPNFKKTTFRKTLKHLKFKYIKRQRNNAIIDRDDIVLWRRNYLYKMKEFRKENRRIFYMDETWVNADHTVNKTWVDPTVKSKRQAFLDGVSTKNPTSKGRRLIVVHIGNEDGFVESASWIFEGSGDYHESMDAVHFEKWFKEVLPKLGDNAVVVMDNAPYHSRRQEDVPNSNWLKANIQQWLKTKNISFTENEIKLELLRKVNEVKMLYKKYAVDELAKQHGIEILRLPPYHCELNPIEFIWADVKGYVDKNNTTFKFERVKELLNEGIGQITPEKWRKFVEHVKKEEEKFGQLDYTVDNVTEKTLIINVTDSNSESTDSENSDSE